MLVATFHSGLQSRIWRPPAGRSAISSNFGYKLNISVESYVKILSMFQLSLQLTYLTQLQEYFSPAYHITTFTTWLIESFDFQTCFRFHFSEICKLPKDHCLRNNRGLTPCFRLPSVIWEIYLRFHIASLVTPGLFPPPFPIIIIFYEKESSRYGK